MLGIVSIAVLSPGNWIENRIEARALYSWVESRGAMGIAIFAASGALLTSVGLPRQLVALSAGYAFNMMAGTLIAILSVSAGALLTFTFARYVGRPWVRRRFPEAVRKVDLFMNDQPFLKILTIRFAPVGTNMLTNLAAGSTALPASTFLLASALGFLPQTMIFVLIGNGLAVGSYQKLIAALILTAVSLVLCIIIYQRRHRHGYDR